MDVIDTFFDVLPPWQQEAVNKERAKVAEEARKAREKEERTRGLRKRVADEVRRHGLMAIFCHSLFFNADEVPDIVEFLNERDRRRLYTYDGVFIRSETRPEIVAADEKLKKGCEKDPGMYSYVMECVVPRFKMLEFD